MATLCPAEDVVLGYIAGQLAPELSDSVDEHLDSCESCRRVMVLLARSPALDATAPADPGTSVPALATGIARGASIGRYLVLDVLGQGGMGVVYAAFDPELDRKVAVKVLRATAAGEAAAARLLREGRAIARLAHPNVVAVFDVGTHEGSVFVAMELVDGTSLDRWLETPRPWREVVDVFVQAGHGLIAAHAAGIVHRDFKPANALIGKDGRVRVTDFGLARVETSERPSRPELAESGDVQLTRTGAIMGTPAYMAPEQFEAKPVDDKTDQFSFAVALYEGLYGRRPFDGKTAVAIYDRIVAGRIGEPPAGSEVPAWLRQIVVRGLAADPNERFPALSDMLAAIDAKRRRRASWWIAGAALVAVTALGALALTRSAAEPCTGARPAMAEIWNPAAREAMHRAFDATHKPFAAAAWTYSEAALDRYASAWVDMHVDACTATAVRKEQSSELLDLRMTCLAQRRSELRALVDVFAHADADVVEHASEAIARLGQIASCADIAGLRAPVPLPASPALRGQVEQLRQELARAEALSDAGKAKQAIAIVPGVLATARTLGYGPLEAEALDVLADLQFETGDAKASRETLRATVVAAEASGHQLLAARAWKGIIVADGLGAGNYAAGLEAADHARAILGRIDPEGLEMAEFEKTLSTLLRDKGDYDAARTSANHSIAIFESKLAKGDPKTARAYNALGTVEWYDGHLDKALPLFERVRDDLVRALGPDHPQVSQALGNLGSVLRDQGKLAEALEVTKRSLAIDEAALGPDHPENLVTLVSLGNIEADLGHDDAALAAYRRALQIGEKAYAPDHPYITAVLVDLAIIEHHHDELAAAREHFERALRADEKRLGPTNVGLAAPLMDLASVAVDEGKLDEARQLAERALAIDVAKYGAANEHSVHASIVIANVASAAGKPAEALAILEKAVALEDKPDANQSDLANTLYNLANELYATDQYARAEPVLRRSLALFEKELGPDASQLADVLTVLAATLDKRGHASEAAPLVERALAIRDKTKVLPRQVAETRATAARILWQLPGGDRERAHKLAQQALDVLATTPNAKRQHDDLARWLAAHRVVQSSPGK